VNAIILGIRMLFSFRAFCIFSGSLISFTINVISVNYLDKKIIVLSFLDLTMK